jgi:hypothetical protein
LDEEVQGKQNGQPGRGKPPVMEGEIADRHRRHHRRGEDAIDQEPKTGYRHRVLLSDGEK